MNLHDTPFDLSIILQSGQVFRWEYKDGWWYGVIDSGVVKIRQDGSSLRCISSTDEINQESIRTYFRLDEDFEDVLSAIMKDNVINE
ncbi:MAG: DNA lyase, partial [Thaumarchaeota archaeon]|nr:DNA lyase [Nitrososphaerota archaeon]